MKDIVAKLWQFYNSYDFFRDKIVAKDILWISHENIRD